MLNLPPGLSVFPEDWDRTPVSVQVVIIALWQENQAFKPQVMALAEQVATLQAEVERLREQVNRNSRNSSKPPSSDPPQVRKYPKREKSGRKRGGQKGHVGKGRKLAPPERVSRVVVSKPTNCQACGTLLLGADPSPRRHQVSELPRVEPEITEYQQHTLTCLACGAQTGGEWPVEMPGGSFGPRIQALIGYLGGRFGMSDRDVQELMGVAFHTDISLGSVPAQEQQVSAALAQPVQEAQAYVGQQPNANVDETGWRQMDQRVWLWVAATPLVTVFIVVSTRSAGGLKRLLGESFKGIIGSDRWSAYRGLNPLRRQLCWAHLKRDFQAFIDRGGEPAIIGNLLLAQVKAMFELWYRVRDGTLSRTDFQVAMQPIQAEVKGLLRIGTLLDHPRTRKTCHNILSLEPALWTFVAQEGVEPTNNAAERPLRRGVIWRRRSFGTQSEAGSVFVERILTTVSTLRQQKRDIWDFLTEACKAKICGDHAPSLLPATA
ncbi:MAG: IS66 family transposase [Anaerolineales bacterium]|nr:MAG: IS66 family transposase [Anaerolineales bacterium]